jgi:hypothetical protein
VLMIRARDYLPSPCLLWRLFFVATLGLRRSHLGDDVTTEPSVEDSLIRWMCAFRWCVGLSQGRGCVVEKQIVKGQL